MIRYITAIFCVLACSTGWSASETAAGAIPAASVFSPPDPDLLAQGRYVYQRNCVTCHGIRGDGRGELAATMRPKPRSFKDGVFKYRTTPAGSLPLDADLERTVRQGIGGTSMPTFAGTLTERDIRAVVQYVKDFSPKWNHRENFAPPLSLPPAPAWFGNAAEVKQQAARGAATFAMLCAPCHGSTGAGNGPAATESLVDHWGETAKPADLREKVLRNGGTPNDFYRVLVTGLDGTPMPGIRESTTDKQRWELIAFLTELRKPAAISGDSATESR